MFTDPAGVAFVVLLRHRADSLGMASLLTKLRRAPATVPALFLVPPIGGLRFFADGSVQPGLDAWWHSSVPEQHLPVYLIDHEPGLPDWLPGIDGRFYIGVASLEEATLYTNAQVTTLPGAHPLNYARLLMRDYCHAPVEIFDAAEAGDVASLVAELPPTPALSKTTPAPAPPPPPAFATGIEWTPRGPSVTTLVEQMEGAHHPRGSRRSIWRRPSAGPVSIWARRSQTHPSTHHLASRMLGRGPTVVVMGSRKGGVGKTSCAAGVAIHAGQILDSVGHMACIVDANIANPDAWGQMNLPARAATVRQVVTALTGNGEPPEPVHAQTPALACYPDSRESTDYSKTDVDRLADYLRRRYTFIVVDMSNRLPDPLGGPEAAAAAYWLDHADVLVLPTTSAKQDFNGVLDYLDVGGLPPAVVAYVVPKVRRNREHEVTRAYLEAIRARVTQIVAVPDEADKVRLAGMENVPVHQLSSSLGRAYGRLTEVVVGTPPRDFGR